MALPLRAARRFRFNRLPLRLEQLETRDNPSISVFGADQGGGPLVAVFDTQASLTTPSKQFYAYDANFRGGVRVAVTDVSGDDVPDIITAAGPGGGPHIKVFDGATGKVIRSFFAFDPSFTGGVYVAGGDVDNDGFGDIVVAAGAGGGPHVQVFSGANGKVIHSFFAYGAGFSGGVRIGTGDVNGDGYADVITGAGPGGGPHVRVFDGKTGQGSSGFFAYPASFAGGVNVAAGDLNGDGMAEIITGPGLGGGPLARVWSGTTAKQLYQFNAFAPGVVGVAASDPNALWTSGLTVGVADFAGGSALDVAVGPGAGRTTKIRIFNGDDHAQLHEYAVFAPSFMGGTFVGGSTQPQFGGPAPQATFSANPVNEGSTGSVSFTNPSGGSGGYTFSFDLDNNGTFDVTGSATGTATILANLVNDGPGTRIVRGRITDSEGLFTDYTTNVAIANVPPSAQFNGSFTGKPGVAMSFAATVTDPSPVDTTAGFSYLWEFGDGGTSTQKAPTHAYGLAGTYSLKLTVRDKDNGATTTTTSVFISTAAAPQATFTGSTANEGNNTNVQFTNPTGGTGNYTYSFDFDNDGTFEVSDSSIGLSSVPGNYFADGPGSRVVRGRIKDSAGAFTDYTTTISIVNLPPTVQLGGPFVGLPNAAISFSATVTDPSPVDQAAGFTYSWNFGDGGTSTQKAPSHTFAAAGTYTVTLAVTDKDGGATTQTVAVIVTSTPSGTGLQNGGFESPNIGSAKYWYQPSGTSWVFNGNSGIASNGSDFGSAPAPGGTQVAFLQMTGSITQSINFEEGTYSISLQAAQRGSNQQAIQVLVDGNIVGSFAPTGQQFELLATSEFKLAAGPHTITLKGTNPIGGDNTAFVDRIEIVDPATLPIITPNDRIPNFSANSTVAAVNNGNWSNPATWSSGKVPTVNDIVSIGNGAIVAYDAFSDVAVKTVAIQSGGSLRFRTDLNTRLTVTNLLVREGGELQIGTVANPVAANVKAEVVFADTPLDLMADPEQFGNGLIALGKVTMHGAAKSDTFVRLALEPMAGTTTLTLSEPVTGWKAGDRLILPDTRQLAFNERWENYVPQWERPTIAAVSANGLVLTLTQPLAFNHKGARLADGNLELLPHVGNTSRNIAIRSQNIVGTRGHTYFTARAEVDIRYAMFAGLGRTTNADFDDTVITLTGSVSHLGTNQSNRYPVQFAHITGLPAGNPDGIQYRFVGNSILCPLDPMPFRWGLTIRNSHYGLIQDNVLFNWAGAGLVAVTGSESYNTIAHNFVVATLGDVNPRANAGRNGSAFWFVGFNNRITDNVAASANGTYHEIVSGSGFNLFYHADAGQNTRIPLYPGADTSVFGQFQLVNMGQTPLLEFSRNEAYGVMAAGMTIWHLGTSGYANNPVGASVISDFTTWHVYEEGVFAYPIHNVTFDGLIIRGDASLLSPQQPTIGWTAGDYWAANVTIRNADIQNMFWGIGNNKNTPGTFRIESSYLRNYSDNVNVTTLGTPGTRATMPARTTIIDNVRFDPLPGAPTFRTISMNYPETPSGNNFIQSDEVFVYNFNGIVGDNFQLYYTQQNANFIVPQTVYYGPDLNGDGIGDLIDILGAPIPGLTNAQAWAQYGIAIAGCICPTTGTRSTIHGLVRVM